MSKFYLFINGIETDPRSPVTWVKRAEQWIERNTPDRAESYEYLARAVSRFLSQDGHVRQCVEQLRAHDGAGDQLIVAAHSNGADIAVKALLASGLLCSSLHLFAPAIDSDCDKNGLNELAGLGLVDRVMIYGSRNDGALTLATWTKRLFGWMGLGYGDLGRLGAQNLRAELHGRLGWYWNDSFGHSTWFDDVHFSQTMLRIVSPPAMETL